MHQSYYKEVKLISKDDNAKGLYSVSNRIGIWIFLMQPIVLLYSIFSLFFLTIVLFKAENKFLMGVLTFWLFGYPILINPNFIIRIKVANFDLQPNRLVLIPLILIFFSTWTIKSGTKHQVNKNIKEEKKPISYEIWLALYIIASLIAFIINYNKIGIRSLLSLSQNIIVFSLIYFLIRWLISGKDYDLLLRSIILFAAISAFVGLVQFFINPEFFHIGVFREAFSRYIRANGLFTAEYDQGFFQAAALLIVFQINRNKLLGFTFMLLSGAAVFTTMHRISWFAWVVALVIIGYSKFMIGKRDPTIIFLGLLTAIMISLIGFNMLESSKFVNSLMVRLNQNTLVVRMDLNKFALNVIQKNPFGIGNYYTSYYNQLAFAAGMPFEYEENITFPVALIVHNGFLTAGVLYGVIGLVTFSLFTFSNIYYYLIRFIKDSKNFLLPFGLSIVFLLFNITQNFSNLGTEMGIIFGLLLGGFAFFPLHSENENLNSSNETHLS